MMRKIKPIFAIALSAILFFSTTAPSFAAEDRSNTKRVISQHSYNIISDTNTLLNMSTAIISKSEALEYVTSNIKLYTSYSTYTKPTTKSSGKYDIAITVTGNATYYVRPGALYYDGITLNSMSTKFTDMGTNPVTVRKIQISTHSIPDISKQPIEKFRTINGPASGATYSLSSGDSRIVYSGGTSTLYCGAIYTFSNGTTTGDYDLMIIYY